MTWLHFVALAAVFYALVQLVLIFLEPPEEFEDVDELAREDRDGPSSTWSRYMHRSKLSEVEAWLREDRK